MDRKKQAFAPSKPGLVRLYTCGPTVYNYAHIGNLRTYIFEDVLKRVLVYNSYQVNHVMNITDVGHLTDDADSGEDKMEKGAAREGKSAWDIAKFYTQAFEHDLADLNIIPPNTWCKATDHIPEQIDLIQKLEQKGFTYPTSDGIYFDTTKLPDYGKLAKLDLKHLQAGARVEIGDKKSPTDFALWKFSDHTTKRQMEWESPWGIGFPGWHIECSAMATKYLGQPFDIHCGGIDHIPVHHTNEIAQSEAAEGKPLANYWMHGEFLVIPNGEKMAKSGENFLTLQSLKDKDIPPLAYRFICLQTHYRKQLTFNWDTLAGGKTGLEHFYSEARWLKKENKTISPDVLQKTKDTFIKHVNNDLDLPSALASIWTAFEQEAIDFQTLSHFDQVLGLKIEDNLEEPILHKKVTTIPATIQTLITQRDEARTTKNWSESDRLRQEIENLGYEVEDTKEGTVVKTQ